MQSAETVLGVLRERGRLGLPLERLYRPSPVLSNIYLHRLDVFVETVLIPEYTRGTLRARNPSYRKVEQALAAARRRGEEPPRQS